jgi:hypothetical protein
MPNGSPPITRITLPACRAHYPGGSNGCARRLLPRPCCLPRFAGGSASASLLSRPAQASLALRPVGLLNRPRRPSSRGSSPSGCPSRPLVSYQSNRQFSGRYLPPLVIRAFGAHRKMTVSQKRNGAPEKPRCERQKQLGTCPSTGARWNMSAHRRPLEHVRWNMSEHRRSLEHVRGPAPAGACPRTGGRL